MKRLVFAELVVLLAAALLLPVVICYRRWGGGVARPLPVSEPGAVPRSRKERRVERLRRALQALRVWCRRSRVEPAASASASPSPPPPDGAQGQSEVQLEQVSAPAAAGQAAGHEEEGVAAWRKRWFGGPGGSRALYTIEEASETEGDVESQCGAEPETPFYTPPASPAHGAEQPEHGESS